MSDLVARSVEARSGMNGDASAEGMRDGHGRLIDYLRISVTDKCNLRCVYCMPLQGLTWLRREQILPLLWIVATAFKSQSDAIAYPPKVIFQPTLEGFVNLFTVRTRYMVTLFIVSL